MSRRVSVAAVLAAFLAACGTSAPDIGAKLSGPTDVVPFKGITVNSADVRNYLAVASGRGNELRIIDLTNDRAVLGPTVVFPLSVPSVPRPMKVAAASMGDGGSDLLVAASAGSASIELVLTWGEQNRMADIYDLGAETSGGTSSVEVLALAAAAVPGAPGQARVIAALSGGKLAVVTATRAADGSIVLTRPAVVRDFGFDAVDLAVFESHATGTEGLWLFAATTDDLDPSPTAELFGVVQIGIGGTPDTWNAVPLDARSPTRLVAAAEVAERITTAERPDTFETAEPLRVYAALDPSGCGVDQRVNCGLATLDPVTRALAPDPSGEMDHRAPMPIPGVPLRLAISKQPANLTGDICNDLWNPATPEPEAPPYPNARLKVAPGTGQRCTSAVAAVTSSNGSVYIYDLGRWSAPNDASLLRSNSRVRATAVTQVRPSVAAATDVAPLLGFWSGDGTDAVLSLDNDLQHWFTVWPGYTPTEEYHLGWKIPLPQFVSRGAIIGRLSTGEVYLAAQSNTGRTDSVGNPVWALGPQLANPANGVHAGDILSLATSLVTTCAADANGVIPETTIASVLPPDPALFPGGAVVLSPVLDAAGQPVTSCWDTALAQSGGAVVAVAFTIRASGHLFYGSTLGYLGRPEKDVRFTLRWQDESNPALTPEQRAITRKLRRFYYPGADKCDLTTPCVELGDIDPLAPGPMLSFRLGWMTAGGRTGPEPVRGEQLVIQTQSGIAPMTRKPTGSGAMPLGIAAVDRSAFIKPGDVVRFYVAYQDDQVFGFSPGESLAQTFSIR